MLVSEKLLEGVNVHMKITYGQFSVCFHIITCASVFCMPVMSACRCLPMFLAITFCWIYIK